MLLQYAEDTSALVHHTSINLAYTHKSGQMWFEQSSLMKKLAAIKSLKSRDTWFIGGIPFVNKLEPLWVYSRYENLVDSSCMFDLVGNGFRLDFLLSVVRFFFPYILFILLRAV